MRPNVTHDVPPLSTLKSCAWCGRAFVVWRWKEPSKRFCRLACVYADLRDPGRFWDRLDRSGGPEACWPFVGRVDTEGYGMLEFRGRTVKAHRMAYFHAHGCWPRTCRHTCDVKGCCNPAHLLDGTQAENMQDARERRQWAFGERNGGAKLNQAKADEIRRRYAAGGVTMEALAAAFGVTRCPIRKIIRGVTWKRPPRGLRDAP
jgi:hypothetical protein